MELHFAFALAVMQSAAAAVGAESELPTTNDHWAFRAPTRPAVPAVRDSSRVKNPIDAFIAAEHERRSLAPVQSAKRHHLLRRVHLDLTGLPPTREQLHAFLSDRSPDAYDKVVDELLESPHYGERWARHWMDVWRYSDWYGRRQVPDVWNSAPQIWRWRDWIVRSLNADKGYDRMVMEMLAADEIVPEDDESVVATGYLVRNWYALNANQWMRDIVEHTGKAFLGLTLNCAHCHDHKYDPITQEDYFRFRAFFEPIELRQDRVRGEADPGPFQKYEYSVLRKIQPLGSVRVFDEKLDAKTIMYRGGDERSPITDKPPVEPGAPAALAGDSLRINPVELPLTAFYPGMKEFIQSADSARRESAIQAAETTLAAARQALAASTDAAKQVEAERAVRVSEAVLANARAQLESTRSRIAADNARYLGTPGIVDELSEAASRAERKAKFLEAEENLARAERTLATATAKAVTEPKAADEAKKAEAANKQHQAAKAVAWQALLASNTTYSPLSPIYPTKSTGRRRALAEWIASRSNPLAARVAVNHIWMRHFGRPLVATVFDFGRNGKPPSHPKLLDWLAVELMDSGWSMKHLHKLIVTSETYRMASDIASPRSPAELAGKSTSGDAATNAAQGAVSAGDATRTVSHNATLDPDNQFLWRFNSRRMEAEVVRDSILFTAGKLDLSLGGPPIENTQEDSVCRRSLYFSVYPEDGGHPRFLETFDAPDACDCYRRTESMIPQQALALTNSRIALDQSRVLARRLWATAVTHESDASARPAAFVTAAFEQVLSRSPNATEIDICGEFLRRQADLFRSVAAPPPVAAADGATAASADPVVRAAESLVHSLFSHNDFVNVR